MAARTRDPKAVRERLHADSEKLFPQSEVRGCYKDPERLLASFSKRLNRSPGLDNLLGCKEISEESLYTILHWLVLFYDDPSIEAEEAPEILAWAKKAQSISRKLRSEERILAQAAEILRDTFGRFEAANHLKLFANFQGEHALSAKNWEKEFKRRARLRTAPGNPIDRGPGRQREPSSAFVEYSERSLESLVEQEALKKSEAERLIADLARDFFEDADPSKLRERKHSAKRRSRKPQAPRGPQPSD